MSADTVDAEGWGRRGGGRRFWRWLLAVVVLGALLVVGHLASNRMLVASVKAGNRSRARLALSLGASPNAWDWNREESPLHEASSRGDLALARLLLDHGAVVNAVSQHGQTPLHVAAEEGRVEVARLLLERGARVDVRDLDWRATPLAFATQADHREVAALLLDHGADPNVDYDSPIGAPLEHAGWYHDKALRALLLQHGAKHLTRRPAYRRPGHGNEGNEHAAGD